MGLRYLYLIILENQQVVSFKQLFLPYSKIPPGDAHTAMVKQLHQSHQCISTCSPTDSNTLRPKVFLNVWVLKCSILIPISSCLDNLPIFHSIESEPFDIGFSQTPELNQLFLCHPITGDGRSEDGRIPDLLDFCYVFS